MNLAVIIYLAGFIILILDLVFKGKNWDAEQVFFPVFCVLQLHVITTVTHFWM